MCLALHFGCSGLPRLYWRWEGDRANSDRQHKRGQWPRRAEWRVQTGWEEKTSRREAQPRGRSSGRLWKLCPQGFYGLAEEAKLSPIWSGESPVCVGEGSLGLWKLPSAFWTGSKSKLYLYIKQLYPIERRSQALKFMRREEAHFPMFIKNLQDFWKPSREKIVKTLPVFLTWHLEKRKAK